MRKLKITGLVSALLVFALLFAACAGLQGSRISGGALSVAFNTGDGTGTAPAALAVSHGGIVVLPGIGDMVAPAGDRQLFFAGWDVNGKHFRPGNTVVANENLECTAVWLPYLALEERFHGQINYAAGFPHNHDQAYLRIILPPTGVGPFPVMILVLGGGWNQGNWFPGAAGHWTTRGFGSGGPGAGVNPFLGTNPEFMPNSPGEVLAERDMSPLARGYALVIIGHRGINTNDADLNRAGLGGFAMPNPVLDVMAGIRYIRRNAEKYQLDPNRFALTGQSASGW
ncbi:MAG: hypothetical protein FWB99_09885, partial [Treponema sp.]|nr:hypothetical protein [Treponema sp.]